MNSNSRNLLAMMLCAASLAAVSGCASKPTVEPPLTVPRPKPTKLPAEVSQIDLKPSTGTLSKGLKWSQDSERILGGGTQK